ncbi:hypothetical protein Ahy_A08g040457 [Arachis hypogaea]|uniref:Transposase MuDR plant domain-containing protein n=1 Tax=Arachis hypogaea TaxID=3818 RepID=A0A445BZC2_ARAHY|nr:hypothetical protein Ahy_A08g040457 [Arachis hypogaea]
MRYETFVIGSDEDLQVLFHCRRSFSAVRILELLAKLEDGVDSSGTSASNPQSTTVGGASTSMPVVAAVVLIPYTQYVAAVHANSNDEPVAIGGDSDDDIPRNTPTPHGGSGSGTQQYRPHLSSLNLEAIGQHQNVEATFMGQGMHDANHLTEFQIGQSFQSKEEVVLSVKDYSIWRGVEYRVMQLDHLKYQGICKEHGNGCMWLICITLQKWKSTWEVRRYNTKVQSTRTRKMRT